MNKNWNTNHFHLLAQREYSRDAVDVEQHATHLRQFRENLIPKPSCRQIGRIWQDMPGRISGSASHSTLDRLEKGQAQIDYTHLFDLSKIYNVSWPKLVPEGSPFLGYFIGLHPFDPLDVNPKILLAAKIEDQKQQETIQDFAFRLANMLTDFGKRLEREIPQQTVSDEDNLLDEAANG